MATPFSNVILDGASAFRWDELNETRFLEKLFQCLQREMRHDFNSYQFFVFASQEPNVVPLSAAAPPGRKILIWISDETSSMPARLADRYCAIFKAYLPRETRGRNIFPFPLGTVNEVPELPLAPLPERPIDMFFSGNLNSSRVPLYHALHPVLRFLPAPMAHAILRRLIRGRGRRLLASRLSAGCAKNHICFTHGFKTGLSPSEYARLLARSKIALCPRGFQSAETFRHMEAMRAGCVIVSEELPDTRWYRDSPIVTVPDWSIGLAYAKSLLTNLPALEAKQEQTIRWWKEICSEEATARHVEASIRDVEPRGAKSGSLIRHAF